MEFSHADLAVLGPANTEHCGATGRRIDDSTQRAEKSGFAGLPQMTWSRDELGDSASEAAREGFLDSDDAIGFLRCSRMASPVEVLDRR
ncbi:MAG TPA: hypothetical protein VLB67_12470 [Acidimicrobiia bacterium]|nr:hypothetical protein [Acidimicrobiia bacterium]